MKLSDIVGFVVSLSQKFHFETCCLFSSSCNATQHSVRFAAFPSPIILYADEGYLPSDEQENQADYQTAPCLTTITQKPCKHPAPPPFPLPPLFCLFVDVTRGRSRGNGSSNQPTNIRITGRGLHKGRRIACLPRCSIFFGACE